MQNQVNLNQLPSLDQLLQLLQDVLSGINEKIQHATKYLKKYCKLQESIGTLTFILKNDQSPNLRQLAGVLLKRNILTLYNELQEQAQIELRLILLERFFIESVGVIRKSIGSLIGSISKLTLETGKWPELYQILGQQTDKSQTIIVRTRGLELLGLILDYSGESLKPFYGQFYGFFKDSITEQDKGIRIETVKCLISLFDNVGFMSKEQIHMYKELITPIIQIVDLCIQEEDEDNVQYCLDAFNYLADSQLTILDDHFSQILSYFCSDRVVLNKKVPKHIKQCVMDLISTISQHHRSVFNKNLNLTKQIIQTLCLVISQPFSKEQLEEDEFEESIQDVSLWLILNLIVNLNKKKIYTILLESCDQFIKSQQPDKMNTAFLLLAQMAEGCSELLERNLSNPVMNVFIPAGLNSQYPEVKGAAIKAITYFAEYLGDSILQYHASIIPSMMSYFNDMNIKVVEKALISLDVFCDNMQDQIVQYLPIIIPTLVQIPYKQNATTLMKKAAIGCIASCISSSAEEFKPFLEQTFQVLHQFIQLENLPENVTIKTEAINALGKISNAFCKDQSVYTVIIAPCIDYIYNCLINVKDYEIGEGCISFFYNLAQGQGKNFEQFFDKVIDHIMQIAASDEGVQYVKQKNEFSLDSNSENEDDFEDEDEIEDEKGENQTSVKVKSSFFDEKAAAIHAIGEFAVACPMKFQKYFEPALAILEKCFDYFQDNVRTQVVIAYKLMIQGIVKCSNNGELPVYKKGLPCSQRFPKQIESLISIEIWQKFYFLLLNERNGEIVAIALECLWLLVKDLGPAYIDTNLDDCIDLIQQLLEHKGQCQHQPEDEEEEEETNSQVFEALTELITTLGEVLQNGFEPGFLKIINSLVAYLDTETRDINDSVQSAGCFSVIYKKCPSLILCSYKQVLPIFLKLINVQDDEINRNIAFGLGVMVERGTKVIEPYLPEIMLGLKNIFDNSKQQETKDNAAAALCRIIMTYPDKVPIQAAMQNILLISPIKGDFEEEKTLIKCILFLAENFGQIVEGFIDKAVYIMVDALQFIKKYKIKQELQQKIIFFIKNLALNQKYIGLIQNTVLQIQDENTKNQIIQMLQ